jgi:hypothetical protein
MKPLSSNHSASGAPTLSQKHRDELEHGSGIAPEVIAERGYATVAASDPRLTPFADYQRASGILFPILPPDGSNGRYSLRRDVARGPKGRYEQPAGQAHRLDMHPRARRRKDDPTVPLCITEGIKKGDALVSAGRCAVALGGVWCFRKECIPDWDLIRLRGRTALIVFDSDAETNPEVGRARDALAAYLTERGARVRIVRVPAAADGSKQGIDDYLAGGDLVDLLAEHCEDWRPPEEGKCDRETCRQVRRERAELGKQVAVETQVITGGGIRPNRRLPYLLWLRRYWADASGAGQPLDGPGRVDGDGWDRVPLQKWSEDVGMSYSMMLTARKELAEHGILETREEYERVGEGKLITRTLVRPSAAASLIEAVRNLTTIVQPSNGHGGRREWRCKGGCPVGTATKRVCAGCGADVELVAVTEEATGPTDFQVENRSGDASLPSPSTYSAELENRSDTEAAQVALWVEVREEVAALLTDFQVENRSPSAAPSAPSCLRPGCVGRVPPDRKLYCGESCQQADQEDLPL